MIGPLSEVGLDGVPAQSLTPVTRPSSTASRLNDAVRVRSRRLMQPAVPILLKSNSSSRQAQTKNVARLCQLPPTASVESIEARRSTSKAQGPGTTTSLERPSRQDSLTKTSNFHEAQAELLVTTYQVTNQHNSNRPAPPEHSIVTSFDPLVLRSVASSSTPPAPTTRGFPQLSLPPPAHEPQMERDLTCARLLEPRASSAAAGTSAISGSFG